MPRYPALLAVACLLLLGCNVANNTTAASSTKGTPKPKANIAQLQAGAVAHTGELSITLATLTDPYTSPNQFTQPKDGNRYVLIHASVQDVDNKDHTVNPNSFTVKTTDSHVYQPALAVTAGQGLQFMQLHRGDITEGDVVFEVPQGATLSELRYDNGIGSDDLFWRR